MSADEGEVNGGLDCADAWTANHNDHLDNFRVGVELISGHTTGAHGENAQLCEVVDLLDLVKVQALHGSALKPT
jgi:uncharacterized protein YciI